MSDHAHIQFEKVLSSFREAVIVLDDDAKISWVNPAAEELIGLSAAILTGRKGASLFDNDKTMQGRVTDAISERRSFIERDTIFRNHSGKNISSEIAVWPVDDAEGAGGHIIILRDLTSAKALERFLSAGDRIKELEILSAGIAHEIKNPLGGIRGTAQLLNEELPDKMKEYTGLILSEVDRINRLVVDFIDMNQPEIIEKKPVNIYPLLDDAIKLVTPEAEAEGIEIERRYDPSLPSALGNADRLTQIFLNLIKNGVEAGPDNKRVTIVTSLGWKAPRVADTGGMGRYLLVEVMDEGEGIDKETSAKIFTPFFSRKKGGAGLGLAVTRRLVQAHDGHLELSNRDDGARGAIASVYLPFAK